MGLKVRAYVLSVIALAGGAIAVALSAGGMPANSELIGIAGFALAFVLVQALPIPFPRGSQVEIVRVEEAVVVPLVLLLEPAAALIAVTLGVLVGQMVSTKRDSLKLSFNTAQLVLSTGAALFVTLTLLGETAPGYSPAALAAALAGLVVMFVVNQLLVAGVMRVAAGTSMRSVLFEDLGLKAGMWIANAALGSLLVLPAAQEPALLLFALVPLIMLHAAWRVHSEKARDEQRLRELGSAVGGMSGAMPLAFVAQQLAASAREVVDASGAEVRLFEESRAWWVRRAGDGLETGDHATGGREHVDDMNGRIAFSVPLAASQGVFGELRVWHERREEAAPRALSRRDRTLLEMLGHQAATALDNSLLAARSATQQRTITQVFEHSSEGMLVLDQRGRVRGWNPAMQSISGFDQATVDSSPIELISPQLAAIVEKGSEPGVVDAVLATADGDRRQVRASFASIDDESMGDEPMWVVVVRDITLERQTERLKDDFVATVSHELRTPLTAIKGFLQTMQRDDIELGAGQIKMFLQIMGEQADRLERLIGDLLDMSAIESGRPLDVDVSPVDLTTTVQHSIATFQAARPQAKVDFELGGVGLVVEADRQRLEQVIINLLDNALKHGGSEDLIHVTLNTGPDGFGSVSVRDHGPGIPVVDQRHIFDRFFVTADSVTRTGGGAGLGLYICRRLVAAMEGEITVVSTVGQGATFTVAMPMLATSLPVRIAPVIDVAVEATSLQLPK
ncbi:MAG: multi-sensor signal transduction histidine kinase [Thermoleophilia bacterium]|nr:multi-sensor signal transduction histidine kinase [Thermoleophilia bacterium]